MLPEIGGNDQEGLKMIKKKCQKKIKEKDLKMQTMVRTIEDLKDEMHQAKQQETQL